MTISAPIDCDDHRGLASRITRRRITPAAPPPLGATIRGTRRAGWLVIVAFLGGFGFWAATAPLAGGTIAHGRVSPESGVRMLQHLEGGIVDRIHVQNGEHVRAGAPLVSLDDTEIRTRLDALEDRRLTRLAEQARLRAEASEAASLSGISGIVAASPEAREAFAAEQRTLDARRASRVMRERVLQQQTAQLGETIRGHTHQAESAAEQLRLMREEVADKEALFSRGLSAKTEVLRLKRAIAEMEGQRGSHLTAIAEARQRIGEMELDLIARDTELREQNATRAAQLRNELAEIEEDLSALRQALRRTKLSAPADGIVTNLDVLSPGAVIAPGAPILGIVPDGDMLLIDAEVAPNDIDSVAVGLTAQIHLPAFSARSMPRIEGTVVMVSADTHPAEVTGHPFYRIRVEVPPSALQGNGIQLRSGMLVDVLVVTRERPALSYLFEPLTNLLRNGMREL